MKKFPKPWFRARRGVWYVTLSGKQHNLGPDREVAFNQYKQLLVTPIPQQTPVTCQSVLAIIDKFLEWCQAERKPKTYEWYRWRLQMFAETIDKSLVVSQLKPFHLDEYLAKHSGWMPGMKHGACRAVQRAMLWAEKKGYIERSPIAHYEKPRPGKRKLVIGPTGFERLLSFVNNPAFRDLLEITWETAARPQESLIVEARHVDLVNGRWIFPDDESKMEQFPRIVYLTDRAIETTRKLMLQYPLGPLFRNLNGNPYTPFAVNCLFCRVQVAMGLDAMKQQKVPRVHDATWTKKEHRNAIERQARKFAPKYCLYAIRHSWATHALQRGIDALTVAILLGHRDPSTLTKVYQHLSQSPEYLRDAAKKAVS